MKEFKSELKHLVLLAFSEGWDVEGVWILKSTPEIIPDWRVEITEIEAASPDGEPILAKKVKDSEELEEDE